MKCRSDSLGVHVLPIVSIVGITIRFVLQGLCYKACATRFVGDTRSVALERWSAGALEGLLESELKDTCGYFKGPYCG